MWIGVVHPPRVRARGCCWRRPSARNDCPLTSAHNSAVETMCNHAAVAAFLNSQSNKNNDENEIISPPRERWDRDRRSICHPCQSSDPGSGHLTRACARPDLSVDSRPRIAVFQSNSPGDRQKRVAIAHGWRRVNVGTGTTARLNRRQIVQISLISVASFRRLRAAAALLLGDIEPCAEIVYHPHSNYLNCA